MINWKIIFLINWLIILNVLTYIVLLASGIHDLSTPFIFSESSENPTLTWHTHIYIIFHLPLLPNSDTRENRTLTWRTFLLYYFVNTFLISWVGLLLCCRVIHTYLLILNLCALLLLSLVPPPPSPMGYPPHILPPYTITFKTN